MINDDRGEQSILIRGTKEERDNIISELVLDHGDEYLIHTIKRPDGEKVIVIDGRSIHGV